MIGARPSKVTPEAVRGVLDRQPYWLAGSYLLAFKSGRYSLEVLAFAVVAACGGSAYDDEAVGAVTNILVNMGYGDEPASAVFL